MTEEQIEALIDAVEEMARAVVSDQDLDQEQTPQVWFTRNKIRKDLQTAFKNERP